MPELALYRKYRPDVFDAVVGQEHIIKVLRGAIKLGNLSHAYLFAGSRGTGKTTVARILAREIRCSPFDLYEIDGASNRGIDEIRALREAVRTLPLESPFKVYIIDEVHMLTRDAFNALLKTLEEPPDHVVFILATTEPQKVPETIASRCQSFVFKKPGLTEICQLLSVIAEKERVVLESDAADLIALLADGSFRDAIGIFQKAISASSDKKIVASEVEMVTGAPPGRLVGEFVAALARDDLDRCLKAVRAAADNECDMKVFVKLALRLLRFVLLRQAAPRLASQLVGGLNEGEARLIEEIGREVPARRLFNALRELLTAHDEVDRSFISHLPLELVAVKLHQSDGQ